MATPPAASYEGGAGGKFRKRPGFRRNSTPYERPPTAIRNPIEGSRNRWFSKIVDPASRIITKSAQVFFSSLFRKNLPAPPSVSETDHEPRGNAREADLTVRSSGANGHVHREGDYPNTSSQASGINDLEQILGQKTFTRAEIDRLTELLHSRTVDLPPENGIRTSLPSSSRTVTTQDNLEPEQVVLQESGIDSQKLLGRGSAPIVSSNALEQELASPAELAKAFMGNRPSKVSPSMLGLRSQALRQDLPLLNNVPFTPKSPRMSLGPRHADRFAGVSENGYTTPRPRGRSAIYSMARTPYSRGHDSGTPKVEAHMTPSTSSQLKWEKTTPSDGKQASKRRISLLDNDIGSVGPIRRIRQKTSLGMSPSKNMISSAPGSSLSNPVIADGSHAPREALSTQRRSLLGESKCITSDLSQSENGRDSINTTNFSSVPSQSTEMAQKILHQLDKLVDSPKQKSSELRLAAAREKSPSKLTLSMLQGKALRSLEDVNSSTFLRNAQNPVNTDCLGGRSVPSPRNSAPAKQDMTDENGPKANGLQASGSTKDVPSDKTSDLNVSDPVVKSPPKRAFQMSAHEDYLELDDDSDSGIAAPTLNAGKEKLTPAVESRTFVAKTVTFGNPLVSSETSPGSSVANGTDTGISDGKALPKDSGFAFAVTPSTTAALPSTLASQPHLSVELAEPKNQTATPVSNFTSKSSDKVSKFETSGIVLGVKSDPKPEASSSPSALAVHATKTAPEAVELVKSDSEKTEKAGDLFKHPENSIFSPVSTSAATNIFSFGGSSNSSSNNGLFSSTTSVFSTPAVPPASTSVPVVIANANGGQSNTSATSSFSSAPFQFGSLSSAPAISSTKVTSLPLAASGVESTDSENKTKQTSLFGNLPGASSPSLTSTTNSVFSFGASGPSSTANLSINNQSLFSAQGKAPSENGTGVVPSTKSMPSQFDSSSPSPSFGLSGSSTLSSSVFTFGSSSTGSKMFGSSSSTSFSTSAVSSSSGSDTSSLFGSSSQSTASPVFGSGFGSSPSPATTGFSFGASATTSATGSSSSAATGFSFGAASASPATGSSSSAATGFAFGASPAAPATGSSSSAATGFSFGASAATPAAGSSAATGFSFGASAATPATVSASSAATGFSFGASAATPAVGSASSPATGLFSFGASAATCAASSASSGAAGFSFGAPSATPTSFGAPVTFGASVGSSSGSAFSFTAPTTTATSLSSPIGSMFGNRNQVNPFGSASPNDQMSMEDSMAEDTMNAPASAVPTFGQPVNSPSPFTFGSPAPGGASMFQFGAPQNPVPPQNPSPFQATGTPGGSFSLGSNGGGDKSARKIIKVRRDKSRKR